MRALANEKYSWRYCLFLVYGAFSLALFFADNGLIKYIAVTFVLASLIFLGRDKLFLYLIFLVPAQRYVVIDDGGASLLNIIILYFVLVLFISGRINLTQKIMFFSYFALFAMLMGSIYRVSMIELVIMVKFFCALMAVSWVREKGGVFRKQVVISYVLGVFFMLCFSIIFEGLSSGIRFSGGDLNDSNYAALCCAVSVALLANVPTSGRVQKTFCIFLILFFIFFGILTQSRSFAVMLFVIALFSVLRFMNIKSILKLVFLVMVIMITLTFVLQGYERYDILNNFVERIISPRGGDVSNGRLDIWRYYIDILLVDSNFWFGVGVDAYNSYDLGQVAHNFLIEDLIAFGFISTLFVYCILFLFFLFICKEGIIRINYLMPIAVFIVGSFTLHSFLGFGGVINIFVCALAVTLQYRSNPSKFHSKYDDVEIQKTNLN